LDMHRHPFREGLEEVGGGLVMPRNGALRLPACMSVSYLC
jgi:hypothetical protein